MSMSDIVLIHRKTSQDFPTLFQPYGVWKTCLRQISVVSKHNYETHKINFLEDDEILENEAAIRFLIEVLCGLHSPVFGETEVFGQFKKFIESIPKNHLFFAQPGLLQFVLKTVKSIRTTYLKSLGGLSYGHIIRKRLDLEKDITVWGYGQLAKEVFPWLEKHTIQLIVRSPENYPIDLKPIKKENRVKTNVHIIAAPLHDDEVLKILQDRKTEIIIDLRGHTQLSHPKVISLFEIMQEIEKIKSEQKQVLPDCQKAVETFVEEFYSASLHRPFGWEDLCS